MKVSVIIPCFNNAEYIGKAIDSALEQSLDDVEVIVINDGSTDGSAEVIAGYGDKITFINQKNQGACVARNAGLAVSRGNWVKFLDGDDWLDRDCLYNQLNGATDQNSIQFGYAVIVDENGNPRNETGHIAAGTLKPGFHATLGTFLRYPVLTSITLYPRHVISEAGGFNPNVQRGQEHELHLRLYLSGVDFIFTPIKCYYYRQHNSVDRISNARRAQSYFFDFANFESLVKSASDGPRAIDFAYNKPELAQSAWRTARRLTRMGRFQEARPFFQIARDLGGLEAAHGHKIYRKLVRFIDPLLLEQCILFGKRVVKAKSYD